MSPERHAMNHLGMLIVAGILSGLSGCATLQEVAEYNRTVVLGTYAWDIESNDQGGFSDRSDFWWEQVSDTERFLTPMNATRAKLVRNINFDRINPAFIGEQHLTVEKISGADEGGLLTPGAVVVFRTTEGNLGKLQVEKYRAIHDFEFPEAANLTEKWRRYVLGLPNREMYHLQVRWHVFAPSQYHKYLAEESYLSFSRGFQYHGRYIMSDGTVWCFDSSGKKPVYSGSAMSDRSMKHRFRKTHLLGKENLPDLAKINTLIRHAAKGKITRRESGIRDGGGSGMRAYLYDSKKYIYTNVVLNSSQSGFITAMNQSPEAAELIRIFDKIFKKHPAPPDERCYFNPPIIYGR